MLKRWLIRVNWVVFIFTLSLLVVGCSVSTNSEQSIEAETPIPASKTIELGSYSEATIDPRLSVTPTLPLASSTPSFESTMPVPTELLITPSPSPTLEPSTSTPVILPTATLTLEERSEVLFDLMLTNNGCEFPCWWGFELGETRWISVKEELGVNGFRVGTDYSVGMRGSNNFGVFLWFEVSESIVQSIHIEGSYLTDTEESENYSIAFAQGWVNYDPRAMVNQHGLPTQVLVYSPFQANLGNGSAYHLLVIYDNLGIVAEYVGSSEVLDNGSSRVCPDLMDIWKIGLFLYQPERIDNVTEVILPPSSVSYIAEADEVYQVISWEEQTGLSLESFFEVFSGSEDACFDFLGL